MTNEFCKCVPIDRVVLDGVTDDTVGEAMRFTNNKAPTVVVTAEDVVNGARFVVEGSADGVNYGQLDVAGGGGVLDQFTAIDENGTYVRQVTNADEIKWIRVRIVDYVDGTYTATMLAGVKT